MSDGLYSLLQQAAEACGERPAIRMPAAEHGIRTRSYGELLDSSDRLASLLIRHGAGPGERVAFCYRKSIDAVEALFAVIRTGATYVPLDPAWPADRARSICDDAGIRLWLGSEPPREFGRIATAIVSNARDGRDVPQASAEGLKPASGPPPGPADDVTNILYTSGSTGRPKGVQITTESLMHFSRWAADYFELTPEDRVANHAPYNFDLSTFDLFAAVRAGAAMCPVPERIKAFPYPMARFIAEAGISVWYSVPSALIMMQLRGRPADHDGSGLRHVIFAGEIMPKPSLRAVHQAWPRATLTNLYGPTETNVCTHHRVVESDLADDGPLPIGRPIDDTRVWIMAENGQPAPDGESGELWVAGPTVTSGYFRSPGSAAEKARRVPTTAESGDAAADARRVKRTLHEAGLTTEPLRPAPDGVGPAYRTGDRVSRRADGALMFHGRLDRMIKCRGHRVEPGEIEAVLCRHPAVREAAVVPIADPVFGNRIRACVAVRDGRSADPSQFAAHCRTSLPNYMLPDEWRFLPALPRTDRGKIDLQSLGS